MGQDTAEPVAGLGPTIVFYSDEDLENTTEALTEAEKEAVRQRQHGQPYDRAAYNRAVRKLTKSEKVKGDRNREKQRGQPKKKGS